MDETLPDGDRTLLHRLFRRGELQVSQRALVDLATSAVAAVRILTHGPLSHDSVEHGSPGPAEVRRLIGSAPDPATLDAAVRARALAASDADPLVPGATRVTTAHSAHSSGHAVPVSARTAHSAHSSGRSTPAGASIAHSTRSSADHPCRPDDRPLDALVRSLGPCQPERRPLDAFIGVGPGQRRHARHSADRRSGVEAVLRRDQALGEQQLDGVRGP